MIGISGRDGVRGRRHNHTARQVQVSANARRGADSLLGILGLRVSKSSSSVVRAAGKEQGEKGRKADAVAESFCSGLAAAAGVMKGVLLQLEAACGAEGIAGLDGESARLLLVRGGETGLCQLGRLRRALLRRECSQAGVGGAFIVVRVGASLGRVGRRVLEGGLPWLGHGWRGRGADRPSCEGETGAREDSTIMLVKNVIVIQRKTGEGGGAVRLGGRGGGGTDSQVRMP